MTKNIHSELVFWTSYGSEPLHDVSFSSKKIQCAVFYGKNYNYIIGHNHTDAFIMNEQSQS